MRLLIDKFKRYNCK